MAWAHPSSKRSGGWKVAEKTAPRRLGNHRRTRPSIEGLEDRLVLLTVSDGGSLTLSIYLANNESFGIRSEGSTYDFTLGGSGTFTNGGVSNSGDFGGFGTNTLVLEAAGIAHYSTIDITDADVSVGATGTNVTLLNSGTNTYSTSIDVTVDQNPEPTDVMLEASTFTGSAGLDVTSTGSVLFTGGAVSTASGPITLAGGTAGTLGYGTGVNILDSITTTSGNITITGSSTQQPGVLVQGPGTSVTTVDGNISITGTTTSDYGPNSGVDIYSGLTISTTGTGADAGSITIKGTNTGAGTGVSIAGNSNAALTISTAATGAAAAGISITGTADQNNYGLYVQGPEVSLTTVDGEISLTGSTSSNSASYSGVVVFSGVTISTTGTDANGGSITLDGTADDGAGGVFIQNNNSLGSAISTAATVAGAGGITITGTTTSGISNGVYFQGPDIPLTTADGDIAITGNTASPYSSDSGVEMYAATIRTTATAAHVGSITIDGTDTGTGDGVDIGNNGHGGGTISTAGTGAGADGIAIMGTSSSASSTSDGVYIQGPDVSVTDVDGSIAITGSSASASNSVGGVQVYSANITTTGGDAYGGSITIDGTDTGQGAGVDIGNDGNGGATIGTAGTGAGVGDITIKGTASSASNVSNGVYIQGPDVSVTTVDGDIAITGNTSSTYGGNSAVGVYSGATIRTTGTGADGGSITIDGTNTGTGAGISIAGSTGTTLTINTAGIGSGAGGISLMGASDQNDGVYVQGPGLSLTTVDGDIAITGSSPYNAVAVYSGSAISTTGTGAYGGSISIDGTATGPGTGVTIQDNNNSGITISTVGAAGITVLGTSSQGDGVYLQGPDVPLTSVAGTIEITGRTSGSADGASITGGTTVQSTTGAVMITGSSSHSPGISISGVGTEVVSQGDISLSTSYVLTGDDAIDVQNGAEVHSTGGSISLASGGGVSLDATSTLSASTALSIQGDAGNPGGNNGANIQLYGTLASGSAISITGGPDADTITVEPKTSTAADIAGGGGADAITVAPATVTGTVDVTEPSSGTASLAIDGSSNNAFVVNGTQATFEGASVDYTDIPTVSVYAESGTNSFTVSPSMTVSLNVYGANNPITDTLTVDTPSGQTSSVVLTAPGTGHVQTTGGYLNINFTNLLTLPLLTEVFDEGTSTLTIQLASDETLSVQSSGSSYHFGLSGGTFTSAGVVTPGLFTGFGSSALTLQAMVGSNPSFKTIDIIDGGTGDAVDFVNSGTNSYASSFDVMLENSPQTEAVKINQSSFSGTAGLSVSTTEGIEVVSGTLATVSGSISLSQGSRSPVGGNLIGVYVESSMTSTSGAITITGQGGTGTGAGMNEGVRIANSGRVTTTSGAVSITGYAGSGSADAGVDFLTTTSGTPVVATVSGSIQIKGKSYYQSPGVLVSDGTAIELTGAGTVNLYGYSEVQSGVIIQGPGTKVTSVSGAIQVSGSSEDGDGLDLVSSGSVTSTGTGTTAAPITIDGSAQGVGVGVVVQTGGKVTSNNGPIAVVGSDSSADAVQVNATGVLQATGGANIQVTASGSQLTVDGGTISTASGFVTLTAATNLQLIDGAKVSSAGNAVTVKAARNLMIDATSSLSATAATSTFTITGGGGNQGGKVTVLGTLQGSIPGQILGGNGNDTFLITPVKSTGFTLAGGAGNDAITIAPVNVSGPVNIGEAAGAGSDTLTVQGTASNEVFSVGGLATIVDGHEVTYTPYIPSITVKGADNDVFLVSPSTTATFSVQSGVPTGPTGDSLTVFQPQGQTTTLTDQMGNSGTYTTTGGYQDVTYTNIATLAPPNTASPSVTGVTFFYGSQSFTVQDALPRDLPWEVTSIEFTFNVPVDATLNSLSFTGTGIPVLKGLAGSGTSDLTWTFTSPVTATNVVASLASSGANAVTSVTGGHPLNGNTATSGANPFDIALQDLYGDVDGDGIVATRDGILILSYISNHTSTIPTNFLDVNGDGVVNTADFTAVRGQLGHTI